MYKEFANTDLSTPNKLIGLYSLPAGSWSLNLNGHLRGKLPLILIDDAAGKYALPGQSLVVCSLSAPNIYYAVLVTVTGPTANQQQTWTPISLTQAITVSAQTLLTLRCATQIEFGTDIELGPDKVELRDARITAVPVASFVPG